jgi:hypothetical protein
VSYGPRNRAAVARGNAGAYRRRQRTIRRRTNVAVAQVAHAAPATRRVARPYVRAARSVAPAYRPVGRAVRRQRRAAARRSVFHQRIGKQGFGKAQRRATRRALNALQHMPDIERANLSTVRRTRLERQTYRRDAYGLISRVQRAGLASHARRPRFVFDSLDTDPSGHVYPAGRDYSAYVGRLGTRKVHVAPLAVEQAFGADKRVRRYTRHAPLHEWAHTLQREHVRTPEGGAELFEAMAERRARLGRAQREYGHQRRQVRRQHRRRTSQFVAKDQFDPLLLHRRRRTRKSMRGFG